MSNEKKAASRPERRVPLPVMTFADLAAFGLEIHVWCLRCHTTRQVEIPADRLGGRFARGALPLPGLQGAGLSVVPAELACCRRWSNYGPVLRPLCATMGDAWHSARSAALLSVQPRHRSGLRLPRLPVAAADALAGVAADCGGEGALVASFARFRPETVSVTT
jgi:hypothetical protein